MEKKLSPTGRFLMNTAPVIQNLPLRTPEFARIRAAFLGADVGANAPDGRHTRPTTAYNDRD